MVVVGIGVDAIVDQLTFPKRLLPFEKFWGFVIALEISRSLC